ncbi:MAG: HAMP domain-containing sensor histidine kinase [Bacteroidales bacterium]
MEEKLVPAHIFFLKWFIRIRWIAVVAIIASNFIVSHFLNISVEEDKIYIIAGILFLLNVFHWFVLKRIKKDSGTNVISRIKRNIHFQIITDLILLTLLIHFSGGIENPLILFYFFHLIIASSIFSTLLSYLYAAFAILLALSMSYLECFSVIPHYPLEGFVNHDLYNNILYVSGAGFVFACTSMMVVWLSHMIINRSIKSEETYVKTNIELQNKDKLKNEYVLRVTHDIKGHVAAVMSCLEVVRSKITGSLNEVQEEFINRAYERAEFLSEFIKDLLNLTKKRLQSNVEFEEFSLPELINRVVAPVKILLSDKGINFNLYVDNSVGTIRGNPYAIEELYSNLLLNSVKYTPKGGHIELNVRKRMNYIISEVSDSGIGIPKDEIPKIFDEFYRASNVQRDVKSGTGLGLSIVKEIVNRHKGKIKVESEEGVWTKFTVMLPLDPDRAV